MITYTHSDMTFAAGFLTCWNHALTKQCWKTVRYSMQYLKDTLDYSILFDEFQKFCLVAYLNSDWSVNLQDRKSITESLIKIADDSIFWCLTKQTEVSLSSTETEYIVASKMTKNIITICSILMKLEIISVNFIFSLLIDNMSSIAVSGGKKIICNAWHVDIYYHHIRDLIQNSIIKILHISSRKMTADNLTKTLGVIKFKKFRSLTGLSKESLDIEDKDSSSDNNFDSKSK